MATRRRRGMLIKNISEQPLSISMRTRTLHLKPGEEVLITAEEVRDPAIREALQFRTVAVVRPATEEEEEQLRSSLQNNRSTS